MALAKKHIAELYQKRAGFYDFSANLYYLIGIREFAYRRFAVEALNLNYGDTVVEIGCGTGLNFRLLRERVGEEGKIIGVDLTPEMLSAAGRRIERNQWENIELVQCDAGAYTFPEYVGGVISTFAITLVEEYDKIIRRGAAALGPGKKLVVLDFKLPANWPMWLVKFFVILTRPSVSRWILGIDIRGSRWIGISIEKCLPTSTLEVFTLRPEKSDNRRSSP